MRANRKAITTNYHIYIHYDFINLNFENDSDIKLQISSNWRSRVFVSIDLISFFSVCRSKMKISEIFEHELKWNKTNKTHIDDTVFRLQYEKKEEKLSISQFVIR